MLTPYQDRKMKILWLRFTHQMIFDRKRTEEKVEKTFSKQMCQFPTNTSEREGATVAATPTFSAAGCFDCRFAGRTGSVLPWKDPKQWETPINYHKCPTFVFRHETPAIFRLN